MFSAEENPEFIHSIQFPATTLTLIPQSIDEALNGVGTEGNFTTYNVTLASYDLIPALAEQMGKRLC